MDVIDAHLHLFQSNSAAYPRPIHPGLAVEDREVLAHELNCRDEKGGSGFFLPENCRFGESKCGRDRNTTKAQQTI